MFVYLCEMSELMSIIGCLGKKTETPRSVIFVCIVIICNFYGRHCVWFCVNGVNVKMSYFLKPYWGREQSQKAMKYGVKRCMWIKYKCCFILACIYTPQSLAAELWANKLIIYEGWILHIGLKIVVSSASYANKIRFTWQNIYLHRAKNSNQPAIYAVGYYRTDLS